MDELIKQAAAIAIEYDLVSVSLLQRKLMLPHSKALEVLTDLTARGIVNHDNPRKTLITIDDYEKMFGGES